MIHRSVTKAIRMYRYIINHYQDCIPFSSKSHEDIFLILKTKFEGKVQDHTRIKIDRKYFEKVISGNNSLEEAYIDNYTPTALFYVHLVKIDDYSYEFYVMSDKIILLIFFKNTTALSHDTHKL